MMRDSKGQSVPPAAMNYANLARNVDPVGRGFYGGDGDREHGAARTIEALREGNHPVYRDERRGGDGPQFLPRNEIYRRAAREMGIPYEDYIKLHQKETLRDIRAEAKDDVLGQMKNDPYYSDEPRQAIQRMPRPEDEG